MTKTAMGLLGVICLLAGCATNTKDSSENDTLKLDAYDPEAMTVEGWLNPKTLEIHAATVEPEDGDMIIRGKVRGWLFEPESDIVGALHEGPVLTESDACWLILSSRELSWREGAEAPPEEPYLEGKFDSEEGLFYPSSKVVHGR